MKAFLLLCSALSLFADNNIKGTIPAHHRDATTVAVDSGKWGVEVLGDDKADFTCSYSWLGKTLDTQEHTSHCYLKVNSVLPAYIVVDITNNGNQTEEYEIRSFAIMSLK